MSKQTNTETLKIVPNPAVNGKPIKVRPSAFKFFKKHATKEKAQRETFQHERTVRPYM